MVDHFRIKIIGNFFDEISSQSDYTLGIKWRQGPKDFVGANAMSAMGNESMLDVTLVLTLDSQGGYPACGSTEQRCIRY